MEYSEDFHKKIAEISLACFEKLPKTGKPTKDQWTVLSAIVQETDCLDVVALGTGSKCLGKTQMSKTGEALNDSHAEILCRRAFLKYIYNCLENKKIFNLTPKGFSLKKHVKFHFFTSHVPCGDASIFPKNLDEDFGKVLQQDSQKVLCPDSQNALEQDSQNKTKLSRNFEEPKPKKRKIAGDICRTGAKCLPQGEVIDPLGPGDKYHVVGVVRTKPGRGDPTLSVSCSDKLAKWFHLGVQGALISHLIPEPIYLQTITICGETPFNASAFGRALFDRIANCPLQPHRPKIFQTNVNFAFAKTSEKKPCPSSIIYFKGFKDNPECKKVEVSVKGLRQGITKTTKREQTRLSVCKLELFNSFHRVLETFDGKIASFSANRTYRDFKNASLKYQENWRLLKDKGFRIWTEDKTDWELFDRSGEVISRSLETD